MAFLTREAILEADDMKTEVVPVPEWGGDVNIRCLTGRERDDFEASMVEQKGKKREVKLDNLRAKLVFLSCVGEDGRTRLFTDKKDVELLGKKSAAALDRVFEAAQRISGLRKEDIDELTKNSEETQSEESGSGSLPSGDAQ